MVLRRSRGALRRPGLVGEPDAHRHPETRRQLLPRVPLDTSPGGLADGHGGGLVDVGQHQHELLASVPGAERLARESFLQQVDDALEHPVTDQVSVGVVHLLEEVQIDQGHREPPTGGPGPAEVGQHADEALVEVPAVVAGRQVVPQALLVHLGVFPPQAVDLPAELFRYPDGLGTLGARQVERGPQVLVRLPPLPPRGVERRDGLVQADETRGVDHVGEVVRPLSASPGAAVPRAGGSARARLPSLTPRSGLADIGLQYGHRTHLPTCLRCRLSDGVA